MGGARRGRRLAVRAAVAGALVAGVVLAALPSAGFGSSTGAGGGVAQPPKVKITHGPKVVPKHFQGDVRALPQLAAGTLGDVELPEPEAGTQKSTTTVTPPTEAPLTTMPSPSVSFKGLDFTNWGAGHPPDPVGDVGPNNFVQAVNTSIGIFSKAGTQLAAFTFNSLWSTAGSGTPCDTSNGGDPTVVYDPMGDRFIVADFAWSNIKDGPYYECIAVSKTGDPVSGGWWLYAVRADDATHAWLPDYPKMGIWPDGLYMTANMFDCLTAGCGSASYKEVRGWAFNRDDLESGAPLRSVVVDLGTTTYFSLLPSNLRGGAPPAGEPNFFVSESQSLYAFEVFKFHVDYSGSGSTFTGPTNVSQTSYTVATSTVPSPANSLDSLGERMMMQAQYRNIGGTESLWVNHTVRTSSSGPDGIQWAQLDVTGGTVATAPVQQQIYGNVGSDGLYRWMGSLAVDKDGNMAVGYSVSSSSVNPDIRYAGRLSTDPSSTLPQGETTMLSGVTRGSQSGLCGGGTCTRWGDYSAMSVAPDGCTFWYVNEYYETTGLDWQTRIGSFKFPSCTTADTNPPTATNENATTDQGVAVPITLHGSDQEVCELTFSIVATPANGTLGPITNNACTAGSPNTDTASVTYTPNGGFSGGDSFTYKVNDGTNNSNTATVSITVNAGTGGSYDHTVLADSPVGYWRLDEGSGTSAADSSGNGNVGVYQNGVSLGAPGLISGGDAAASFDGTNQKVLVPDSVSVSPTTAVSVEAWMNGLSLPSSPGNYRTVAFKPHSYWLRIEDIAGVDRARFYVSDGGSYHGVTATGVALSPGSTYHLVGTFDGTTLRVYVNGVQQGSASYTGAIDDSTTGLWIDQDGGNGVPGRLDEVAIYGQALTPTQIQTHYTVGAPPPDYPTLILGDGPAGYWRLDEGSGTSAADSSGNGNVGVYQNGVSLGAPGLISGGDAAASFDGTNQKVLVPDSVSVSPTTAVSVEAWMNGLSLPSSPGNYRTVAFKPHSYWLRIEDIAGVDRARFYVSDGGSYHGVTATGVALSPGSTYHLVGTFDGTTLRVYVNGVQQGSASYTGAIDDSTTGLWIDQDGGNGVPGRLDEVAIYGQALTPTQIQTHYTVGAPVTYPSTVLADAPAAFWRLGEWWGRRRWMRVGTGTRGAMWVGCRWVRRR